MMLRLFIILAAFVGSLAALVPTVAPEYEAEWLFTSPLQIEAPFSSGLRLYLDVDTEAALATEVSRDVFFFRRHARTDGVELGDMRTVGPAGFVVASELAPKKLIVYVENTTVAYRHVQSKGTVHRFEMLEEYQQVVRDFSLRRTTRTLNQRAGTACRDDVTVEVVGPQRIHVDLGIEGDLDHEPCL